MAKEGLAVIQANNRRVATAKKAAARAEQNLQAAKKAGDEAQKAEDVAKEALDAAQKAVEAAKGGLEAAKKTVDTAKKTIEAATRDHNEATTELKDAEQSQKAAQKKWEVVDLVEEDEEKSNSSSGSKKRAGSSSDSEVNSNKKIRSISDIPDEIIVSGCGLAEVNGTYNRKGNFRDAPMYFKEGQWKGEDATFIIYQLICPRSWGIRIQRLETGFTILIYGNANDSLAPPSDGWKKFRNGVEPPPEISWE